MFSKFACLVTLIPFAAALTVDPLIRASSQAEVTVSWAVTSPDDPAVFTIELRNDAFNDHFAIANAVDASLLSLTLTLPVVPDATGYTIQLVDVGNIDNVYAESSTFSVGAVQTDSTTGTDSSTSSGSSSSITLSTSSRPTTTRPIATVPTTSASPTATGEGSTFNGASPIRFSMSGALLAAVAGVAAVAL